MYIEYSESIKVKKKSLNTFFSKYIYLHLKGEYSKSLHIQNFPENCVFA